MSSPFSPSLQFGYRPLGIRLDSGDLAYLSRECRKIFTRIGDQYKIEYFAQMTIVASNDLSEKVLYALKEQGHEIDTCQGREERQPGGTASAAAHEPLSRRRDASCWVVCGLNV